MNGRSQNRRKKGKMRDMLSSFPTCTYTHTHTKDHKRTQRKVVHAKIKNL